MSDFWYYFLVVILTLFFFGIPVAGYWLSKHDPHYMNPNEYNLKDPDDFDI